MVTPSVARGTLAPATPLLEVPANPLVEVGHPYDTRTHVGCVLAFIRDWSVRKSASEPTPEQEHGLSLVLAMVEDAVWAAGDEINGGAQ